MFIVDERVDIEKIRQFAEQYDNLPEKDKETIKKSFESNQSIDFYTGLLSGLSSAYTIMHNQNLSQQDQKNVVSGFISCLSKMILEKVE